MQDAAAAAACLRLSLAGLPVIERLRLHRWQLTKKRTVTTNRMGVTTSGTTPCDRLLGYLLLTRHVLTSSPFVESIPTRLDASRCTFCELYVDSNVASKQGEQGREEISKASNRTVWGASCSAKQASTRASQCCCCNSKQSCSQFACPGTHCWQYQKYHRRVNYPGYSYNLQADPSPPLHRRCMHSSGLVQDGAKALCTLASLRSSCNDCWMCPQNTLFTTASATRAHHSSSACHGGEAHSRCLSDIAHPVLSQTYNWQ